MLLKNLWLGRILLIASLPLLSCQATANNSSFTIAANDYFDQYYLPTYPTQATQLGIHSWDEQLEDYSKTGIGHKVINLRRWKARFDAIDTAKLSEALQADREMILNDINSQLLTLNNIRPWENNPDFYSSLINYSAFTIISRRFAPADERLRALIAREKHMLETLNDARHNLKNPPKIYTEITLEQLPAMIRFFKNDIPAAFKEVTNISLKKQFVKSNGAVIAGLKDYQAWLKKDVLPQSHGDFRIGAENLRKKLHYDEMVDIAFDQLIAIDMADMRKNQKEFLRIASELDPNKTAEFVLNELKGHHPEPKKLLATFQSQFDTLIRFIQDKKIVTIPSKVQPLMEETPPFLRAITFASMDTPGPFEKVAKEAFFNVTLPDSTWQQKEAEQFMSQFNYPAISSIAIHETYPGHYVQFLWISHVTDRVHKILGAMSNAEGWAHYCEQMMLDEGFDQPGYGASNARESKMLRLGQLQEALLRNARFIVGIKMHTGQMSFNEAIQFFIKEGHQSYKVALVETKRGTTNPTYLYYTLGKLQILKLRADVQAKEGAAFNLQHFHDDFMRQGFPPIKIVRKAMLHDDSETLSLIPH